MGSPRKSSSAAPPAAPAAPIARVLWRPKVWGALALVLAVGFVGNLTWKHYLPSIAQHAQYQIIAESIRITPPPAWIRADVKAEVLRDSSLIGKLSVIDDHGQLQKRVRDAFTFHPWVEQVDAIRIDLPASLRVELRYRRPVAAVETIDQATVSYLPVDPHGVRLPESDFSDYQRRSLPRITGVAGVPSVGDRWADERVVNAADLAAKLADVWNQLRLVEIVPSMHAQVRGDATFFAFEIMTSGGTRILWGAAPGREQDAAESPFDDKRKRLLDYAISHGHFDSIDGPKSIDVRSDLVVVPHEARRPGTKPATDTKHK